jgi:hypothetical protein
MPTATPYHDLWLVLHLVTFALGTGTAIFNDILFVRALRRPATASWSGEQLAVASAVIWAALLFVVVSGVALTLPRADELLRSGRYLTKMAVVVVILVNGIRLHLVLLPRLTEAFFRVGATSAGSAILPTLRRQAFVAGAISSGSWLSAVALGGLPDLPNGALVYPLCYLLVLGGGVCTALLADRLYARRLRRASERTAQAVAQQLLDEVEVHQTWFSRPR